MHTLILNRNFELPGDGWYHIAPLGEFPHAAAGVVQVIDPDACRAIVNAFHAESAQPNFPGLLIDFDHFSLDRQKPSEAAGWICDVQFRDTTPALPNSAGLWAQIRWSDRGEQAVRDGRYRFLSPVWSRDDGHELFRRRPLRGKGSAGRRRTGPRSTRLVTIVAMPSRMIERGYPIREKDVVFGYVNGGTRDFLARTSRPLAIAWSRTMRLASAGYGAAFFASRTLAKNARACSRSVKATGVLMRQGRYFAVWGSPPELWWMRRESRSSVKPV